MRLPRGLYGIADASFGDPFLLGQQLVQGGAQVLQLRCKGWALAEVAAVARALSPSCREAGVPLLLNDHPSLAGLGQGVHLGQDDGPVHREALPPGALVGRSTHDLGQLADAVAEGVDYVGFGPVFGTETKASALPPRGLEALAAIVQASPVPVVAIGGVNATRLPSVRAAGAAHWAIISAILAAPNPVEAARECTGS